MRRAAFFAFYITILSLTTGFLQAATERDVEVPEFDQDEKDTILARACSLALSVPPHFVLFFSCAFSGSGS